MRPHAAMLGVLPPHPQLGAMRPHAAPSKPAAPSKKRKAKMEQHKLKQSKVSLFFPAKESGCVASKRHATQSNDCPHGTVLPNPESSTHGR
jgi:hypothetical protein